MIHSMSECELLKRKSVAVMLTNHCENGCGSCSQHCEIFRHKQEELWYIPPEQFDFNLQVLFHPCRSYNQHPVWLTGGEPTIHPQYKELLEVVASYPQRRFTVISCAGGRSLPKNVGVFAHEDHKFTAFLVSPRDVPGEHQRRRTSYWKLAKKNCFSNMRNTSCTTIYDNKAFMCYPGSAYQRLQWLREDWDNCGGWPLTVGVDPFDRTAKEIEEQASQMCWRCIKSLPMSQRVFQSRKEVTRISRANTDLVRWNRECFCLKEEIPLL